MIIPLYPNPPPQAPRTEAAQKKTAEAATERHACLVCTMTPRQDEPSLPKPKRGRKPKNLDADDTTAAEPRQPKKRGRKPSACPREGLPIPTLEEVEAYVQEQGFQLFTAQEFFYYHESRAWRLGKEGTGERIHNWQAMAQYWEFKRKQAARTKTGDAQASREQRMEQWMDRRLPLKELSEKERRYTMRYCVDHHDCFSNPDLLDEVRRYSPATIGQTMRMMQPNLILRTAMQHLAITAMHCSATNRPVDLDTLHHMARTVVQGHQHLTMSELLLALSRMERGCYGDFCGHLTIPRLISAMQKFCRWRSEYQTLNYRL